MRRLCLILILMLLPPLCAQEIISWQICIKRVLENHPDMEDAQLSIREIEVQKDLQYGKRLPSLSFSASSSRNEQGPRDVYLGAQPFRQPGSIFQYHSTSLSLSYLLFDWGNRSREKATLIKSKENNEAQLLARRRQLMIEAFTTYCELLKTNDLLDLYRQELESLKKRETLVKSLITTGLRPSVDGQRLQVQINNLNIQIATRESQAERYRHNLLIMMGAPKNYAFEPVPIVFQPSDSLNWRAATSNILTTHPAIVQLQTQLEINQIEHSIQKWGMLPNLYFNTSYHRGDKRLGEVYGNLPNNWYTGVSLNLSFPLFRNNQDRIQLRLKEVQGLRLGAQLRSQREAILQELSQFETKYNADMAAYRLYQSSLSALEIVYSYEQDRYQSGTGELEQMMEAFRSLLGMRQSVINASYGLLITQFTLESIDGKWDTF